MHLKIVRFDYPQILKFLNKDYSFYKNENRRGGIEREEGRQLNCYKIL